MNSEEYLSVLNPEQLAAVTHEGSPLLILAGAGSGKTRVITTKIAYLISERGVRPSSILAVTFTKKAAREMVERAELLEPLSIKSQIRTFHSFGSWFLRLHAAEAGLDANFTVYDDDDMVTLITKAMPNLSRQQASAAAHKIALAKDYCLTPNSPDLVKLEADPEFPEIYAAYEARLRETGNADFGDLIMLPVLLMQQNPAIKAYMHSRFKVIMVDEYQDSNVAQFMLLEQLVGEDTYVCVVGDDDQSIYKFRGAEVQNILSFQEHFANTQVIKLERNYRSVAPILSTADSVVSHNTDRLGKTLIAERGDGKKPTLVFVPNQDDEAKFCAELVSQSHKKGCPYSDWAILYRTNAQSLGFETEFLHRKIPYTVVGSLKFYQREEIKDALAYLAFIANPRDEIAFRRVVNKPARGIGGVSQDKIVEMSRSTSSSIQGGLELGGISQINSYGEFIGIRGELSGGNSISGIGLLESCRKAVSTMSKKAREGLIAFVDVIDTSISLIDKDSFQESSTPVESLADVAVESENVSNVTEVLEDGDDFPSTTPAPLADNVPRLSVLIEELVKKSGLVEYHTAQDEIAGTQRVANLQELCNSAVLYPLNRSGLTEFLDHIELDRTLALAEDETDNDAVTLITLHNTKGLEFPRVAITGLEYGVFPRRDRSPEEMEEERRLFYVGITRAKDELYITNCAVRRMFGRTEYMEISPLLLEMNPTIIDVLGSQPAQYKRFMKQAYGEKAAGRDGSRADSNSSSVDVNCDDILLNNKAENSFYEDPIAKRWKKGIEVFHDDYGTGYIVNGSFSDDGEYVINVQFQNGQTKRFMPKYQANRLMITNV